MNAEQFSALTSKLSNGVMKGEAYVLIMIAENNVDLLIGTNGDPAHVNILVSSAAQMLKENERVDLYMTEPRDERNN